jgi:hypothetical protein
MLSGGGAGQAILARVTAFVTAGAGFLLAVLWFDLMFDVQALRYLRSNDDVPEGVLASIATYYARVTTGARPMNRLVAVAMVATIAAVVVQIAGDDAPDRAGWASLGLVLVAVAIAGGHTVPAARRLGARGDGLADQSRLAKSILRDHLLCLSAIAALLVVQLGWAS